jgi:hypothetical protein
MLGKMSENLKPVNFNQKGKKTHLTDVSAQLIFRSLKIFFFRAVLYEVNWKYW